MEEIVTDKQTVVEETKEVASPTPAVETRTDVDPLDELLAQYDQGVSKTVSPPEQKAEVKDSEIALWREEVRQVQEQRVRGEISDLVKYVRGDVPEDIYPDKMIEGWLDMEAREDPRLRAAFMNKHTNPKGWEKVKKVFHDKLAERVSKIPDRQATADREAVSAAVRGASAKVAPEPEPKLGKMTDAEFRKYTRENFGF